MVGISVIVPTYQESRYLGLLLGSLTAQTYSDFEIIIADGGSTDGTVALAKRFGCKVVVGWGVPEFPSLNGAAKVAKGSILLFTAADAILPRETLAYVGEVMEKEGLKAMYCPVYPYDAPWWGRLEYATWYTLTFVWHRLVREANACTALFAVDRKTFLDSGGFADVYGGDSLLSRKLAQKVKVKPVQSLRIPISARKMVRMGFLAFNRQNLTVPLDVFFPPLRSTGLLSRMKFRNHTNDYQRIR